MKKVALFLLVSIILSLLLVSTVSAEDHLILNADELSGTVRNLGGFEMADTLDFTNDSAFLKFTATTDGTAGDGTQFEFNFESNRLTEGYTVKEYPYLLVSYRTNIKGASGVDFNYGLTYKGVKARLFTYIMKFVSDGETHSSVVEVKKFGGGENLGGEYSFDDIDDTSVCNYLRLKPYCGGQMKAGEYFSIEYVGFFKTKEAAEAYTYTFDRSIKKLTGLLDKYRLYSGESVNMNIKASPSYAELGTISYTSDDETVAEVDNSGNITAKAPGKTVVRATDAKSGLSFEMTISVVSNEPVMLYAASESEGKTAVLNVIGDSISYGVSAANATYHDVWKNLFKLDVNNWSRGGSAVTGNYLYDGNLIETFVPRFERMVKNDPRTYDKVTTAYAPDIVLIYGGTNDYNGNWPVGKVGDTNRSTYCGAISELISLSYENYPNAKLVFVTPIKRCDYAETNGQDNCGKRAYELDAYVEAMIAVCEFYKVPCVDMYHETQADFRHLNTVYMKDGVHMTAAGHKIFADVLLDKLKVLGIVKTVGYDKLDDNIKDIIHNNTQTSRYFDAAALNSRVTYSDTTLIDRQRLKKHTLEGGALVFRPETLTSREAPTFAFNLSVLDFAVEDYPYMALEYSDTSEKSGVWVELRGNNNRLLASKELTPKGGILGLDFGEFMPALEEGKTYADLYYVISGFDSTTDMTENDRVSVKSAAFFKTEAELEAYIEDAMRSKVTGDANGDFACDSADVLWTSRYLAGRSDYKIIESNVNLDDDNRVTPADLIILARHIAGWRGYETINAKAIIPGVYTVTFMVDGEEYAKCNTTSESAVVFPDVLPQKPGMGMSAWTLEDGTVISEGDIIDSDITLYADFKAPSAFFGANDFTSATVGDANTLSIEKVEAQGDEPAFYRVTSKISGSVKDSQSKSYFKLKSDGFDYDLGRSPYMAVGIRSDAAYANNYSEMNIEIGGTTLWGLPSLKKGTEITKTVIDLTTQAKGGNGSAIVDGDGAKNYETYIKGNKLDKLMVRISWGQGAVLSEGQTVDVVYVAFFDTKSAAESFTF